MPSFIAAAMAVAFEGEKQKARGGIEQFSLMCQEYSAEEKVLVKTFTGTLSKCSD